MEQLTHEMVNVPPSESTVISETQEVLMARDLQMQRYHTNIISLFLKLNECVGYPKQTISILSCYCPEVIYQLCSACLWRSLDTEHCGGS